MTGFDIVHVEPIQVPNLTYPPGNGTYQILGDADYDTRQMPYYGHIKQLPLWEVVVKSLVYSFCILVSLLGNSAVIIVVWRNKRMWTTTNFYIVNLAVSDLMISASCQWVHLTDDLTEGWMLGAFFCKFNSFVQGKAKFNVDKMVPTWWGTSTICLTIITARQCCTTWWRLRHKNTILRFSRNE